MVHQVLRGRELNQAGFDTQINSEVFTAAIFEILSTM